MQLALHLGRRTLDYWDLLHWARARNPSPPPRTQHTPTHPL